MRCIRGDACVGGNVELSEDDFYVNSNSYLDKTCKTCRRYDANERNKARRESGNTSIVCVEIEKKIHTEMVKHARRNQMSKREFIRELIMRWFRENEH